MGLLSNIYQKIKNNSNFFGFTPPLLTNSQKKFYAKPGFFMTLVISTFTILIALYFCNDLIYHLNPKIQISTHNSNFFPKTTKFSATKKPFFITVVDRNLKPINNVNNFYEFYVFQDIMDIANPMKNIRRAFQMIPCQESHFKGIKLDHMKALLYFKTSSYCLPLNFSVEIEGQYTSALTKIVEIVMRTCANNTNRNCIPENKRNDTVNKGIAILGFYDYDIDPSSYQDFAIPILNTIPIPFTNEVINGVNVEFKNNVIETDSNLFWSSMDKQEIVNLDKYEISATNFNYQAQNNNRMIIFMMYSMNKIVYRRLYKKIPDILGQIGGILNIFILFGNFISIPLTELSFYLQIIKQIFVIKMHYKKARNDNEKEKEKENESERKLENSNNFIKPLSKVQIENIMPKEKNEEIIEDSFQNIKTKKREKKKNSKITLNCIEAFYYLIGKKKSHKEKTIQKGIELIKEIIDIKNIIRMHYDIEKIKYIFENEKNIEISNEIFKTKTKIINSEEINNIKKIKFANNKMQIFINNS